MTLKNKMVRSFSSLRITIGSIGILLPLILVIGILIMGENIPQSISRFYYTDLGNLVTGTLAILGVFMFFYPGYGKMDRVLSIIAGVSALGIALFPTYDPTGTLTTAGILHYIFAAILFLTFSVFSFFQFTKSDEVVRKHLPKFIRNRIYKWCGGIIFGSIVVIAIKDLIGLPDHTILVGETIALWAFGFSWLVKGGLLYKDKQNSKVRKRLDIVVDFDGTCVSHSAPEIGKDIGAQEVLRELYNAGHNLILCTMRSNGEESLKAWGIRNGLTPAINWFKINKIPLYGMQKHPTQADWTNSPKCFGNLVIDDTALGIPLIHDKTVSSRPYVDWKRVRQMLKEENII